MVVEVIDSLDGHPIIYVNKPPATKSSDSRASDNHSKVRYDKSFGGKLKGLSIW